MQARQDSCRATQMPKCNLIKLLDMYIAQFMLSGSWEIRVTRSKCFPLPCLQMQHHHLLLRKRHAKLPPIAAPRLDDVSRL
jgi:hypothetical protein